MVHSGDEGLSAAILFRYERMMAHWFILSWARVQRLHRGVLFLYDVRWVVW